MAFENTIAVIASSLIGAGLVIYGLYQRAKVQASQNWPQVLGKVICANLKKMSDTEGTTYEAEVQYEYIVNGVRHIGKRIGFIRRTYVRSQRAEEERNQYPVNSSVAVYFDPDNPDDAVLVREARYSLIYVAGGIALLGIAMAGFLAS